MTLEDRKLADDIKWWIQVYDANEIQNLLSKPGSSFCPWSKCLTCFLCFLYVLGFFSENVYVQYTASARYSPSLND